MTDRPSDPDPASATDEGGSAPKIFPQKIPDPDSQTADTTTSGEEFTRTEDAYTSLGGPISGGQVARWLLREGQPTPRVTGDLFGVPDDCCRANPVKYGPHNQ